MPDPLEPLPTTGVVTRGVMKRFKGEVALAPTDFTAEPGHVSLVVGQNGAGKTTLLRILATLVTPDGGEVRVNGIDPVREGRKVRAQTGLALVNERSIFWRLSVLENIELFARLRGAPRRTRRASCEALLAELGLDHLAKRDAFALSAGQRQRVVLGRALVGDPAVVLSDEPLRGLDVDAEQLVVDALRSRATAGATVVVATPSEREFAALNDGWVTHVGNAAEAASA